MPAREPLTPQSRAPTNATTPEPVRDDIMSFPGMGGSLPGMPGGAGGNVDPNDPNAVQMVRGALFRRSRQPVQLALALGCRSMLTWGLHSKKR